VQGFGWILQRDFSSLAKALKALSQWFWTVFLLGYFTAIRGTCFHKIIASPLMSDEAISIA